MWVLSLFLFSGCALFPSEKDLRECRFVLEDVAFAGYRSTHTDWNLRLRVHNPQRKSVKMTRLNLWLLKEADTLAQFSHPDRALIPGRDSLDLAFQASVPHGAWKTLTRELRAAGVVPLRLHGDAYLHTPFGDKRLAGAVEREYKVDFGRAAALLGKGMLGWLVNPFSPSESP